ncbi:hypothetical protein HDV06_000802 [Boothiomyces sp. JEL0866]|nr:hypothetical protein HDV06_000802 [Boothiomyces sp. JEL0866]
MGDWPGILVNRFKRVNSEATEKAWYGPYNRMLNHFFPESEDFTVCPQAYPLETRQSVDLSVEYFVELNDKPFLFVEIKRSRVLDFIYTRIEADQQARDRFLDLESKSPLDTLYVISAIGNKCCVYKKLRGGSVEPPLVYPTDNSRVENLAPSSFWDLDIYTKDGRVRLANLFHDLRSQCLNL